ncbi:hypothetical protein D3C77_563350 [compost metagenome]
MPRRTHRFASRASSWPARRCATAAAPPCAPISTCMSRANRKTRIRHSPSPWKAIRVPRKTASRSPSPGRRAGTRRRPGTNSRMKSVAICVRAIRAFACSTMSAGIATGIPCPPPSRRRPAPGGSFPCTTCSAARRPLRAPRRSRRASRRPMSPWPRPKPSAWAWPRTNCSASRLPINACACRYASAKR